MCNHYSNFTGVLRIIGAMFFAKRRRGGGGGLVGLILILGVLYYTGVLPALWSQVKNSSTQCYATIASTGVPGAQAICSGVNSIITTVDVGLNRAQAQLDQWLGSQSRKLSDEWSRSALRSPIEALGKLTDLGLDSAALQGSGLLSGEATLEALLNLGPSGATASYGGTSPLVGAMDRFTIGQRLMASQPALGTQWMKQGASFGEYGLLPQLSLGNYYMTGANGVPADPQQALAYYTQAQRSLTQLQGNQNPASQQLLATLPASPEQIQAQITAAIKQIAGQY